MDLGLRDAAVLVTGGTQGMGRAAAMAFAEDGARVAVLARSSADLEQTCAALRAAGSPDAFGLQADLSDAPAVEAAFAVVGERWGELNTLVNTVGPGAQLTGGFDDQTDERWQEAFDLMTMGSVRTVRAALPWLRRADWARIVNVSAHSVKRQSPTLVTYTAGKAALTSLSKNLSLSLAEEGILVNTVSPGTFMTGQIRDYVGDRMRAAGLDPEDSQAVAHLLQEEFGDALGHLGRGGEPEEIGPVIAFVGSRRNSYMTGADINVDGGSDFC